MIKNIRQRIVSYFSCFDVTLTGLRTGHRFVDCRRYNGDPFVGDFFTPRVLKWKASEGFNLEECKVVSFSVGDQNALLGGSDVSLTALRNMEFSFLKARKGHVANIVLAVGDVDTINLDVSFWFEGWMEVEVS